MREKMNKRATRKAFTLVELVIVIAVIGILASVLVPTFASVINSAKDNASIQQATNARDEYIATNLISPEEAIGLLIETPRDLFIVNERCEVVRVNRDDYDLNQYDKLPDIPTIKDVHIYAKKNTDIYTITFLVKDGTIDGNKKVYTKHKSDKIYSDYELTQESPIPKAIGNKKGYNSVFKGWQYGNAEVGVLVINEDGTFTNETTKSIFKDGKYNIESDINLYARFEMTAIEYTISYELDGGTNNENNPAKYTIEDEIILKDATKENYTFKGWYTDSESNGEPITKIAKGTINDVTLYAKFVEGTESTYSVEYYLQNIENDDYTLKGEDTKSDIKGATGETVTADINTYEGFEQNTSSEKIAEASGEVKFDGSLVLKVYYNRIKYTITWQGANGVLKTEEYKYEAMPLYEGETPTKEQDNLKTYNFKAWNPTIEKVVRDTTYTAKFEETARKYDVIIYDENKTEITRRIYSCDTEFDLTTINVDKEGWEFLGFTTEENIGTTNYVNKIAVGEWGEKKFYANYRALMTAYKVEHYQQNLDNDDYTLKDTENLTGETNTTVNATSKTYEGFTFDDDNTNNIKSGTINADGSLVLKLYYTRNTYTITWNVNGATTNETYKYGATPSHSDPTKEQDNGYTYTFSGWTPEISEVVSDTTYTAQFTQTVRTYTITYNLNGGKLESGKTNFTEYTIETETFTLNNPTKEGFTFTGWTGSNGEEAQTTVTINKGTTGNLTYTANYDIVNYTIEYVLNGGTNNSSNPANYNIETENITLQSATKDGYTFGGWYLDSEFNTQITTIEKGSTGDKTLYAKFTASAEHYAVEHYLQNLDNDEYTLEITESLTEKTDTMVTAINKTYTGFTFDDDNTNNIKSGKVKADGSLVLKLYYTRNTYTITWNVNGTTTNETYKYGATPSFKGTTTKPQDEGYTYTFSGWTPEISEVVSDTTYTAQFTQTVRTYTITYNLNGGTANNPNSYTIETETFTLNNPTKEGYTFTGWTGSNGTETQKGVTINRGTTGDLTYTANYDIVTYTIEYVLNGGTNNSSNPANYNIETNTITLQDATKQGYAFGGWYSDSEFNTQVTSITKGSTGNKTLYAKFTANTNTKYKVEHYQQNLNDNNYTLKETDNLTGTTDTTATATSKTYTGFTFDNTNTSNVKSGTINANESLVLKLYYTRNTYTITWNVNGATTNETYKYGATPSFKGTTTKPQDNGYTYTFSGWTPTIVVVSQNATYTAQFTQTARTYTITYNTNGGSSVANETYTYNVEKTLTATTSKNGYTFNGWYSDSSLNTKVTSVVKGTYGDKTYYAKFSVITYTITYTLNGGTNNSSNPANYNIETNTITLQDATRQGYTFGGWYSDSSLSTRVTSITKGSTGNKTLYAKFTANTNTKYKVEHYQQNINDDNYTLKDTENLTGTTDTTVTATSKTYTGFTFDSNNASNIISGKVKADGSLVLKLYYNRNTYTITWNVNGATTTENYRYGATPSFKGTTTKPQDNGYTYTFSSWAPAIVVVSQNATYTAQFTSTARTYSITYNTNGGSSVASKTYTYNVEKTLTATTSKNGCTFDGWYSDSTFKTKVESITKGSYGNKTYYAKFVNYSTKESNGQLTITGYTGSDTNITIPSSINGKTVVAIGDSVFNGNSNLERIEVPNTVTSIGSNVFEGCENLVSVTLSNNLTTLGNCAFSECGNLTEIVIPNGVKILESETFNNCIALEKVTLGNALEKIENSVFAYCENLKSIIIPSSVKSIGSNAFDACTNLTSMIVESGNKIYDSRNNCNAIIETNSNKLIYGCQKTIIPSTVTSIESYAFYGHNNLTDITIPSSITSIGSMAFSGCNLTSVNFKSKDGWKAGTNAISGSDLSNTSTAATYLRNKYLIYTWTRDNTSSYSYTTGPDGLLTITGYTGVDTELVIPSSINGISVIAIGNNSFQNNENYTSIVISEGIQHIGDFAFEHMGSASNLENIVIPNSVTSIGIYAFHGCVKLTSIKLPDGLTSISDSLFDDCTNLTSVTIPDSVTSIGDYAFYDCTNLTSVDFKAKDGWKAGNTTIDLSNTSTNATYLKDTFLDCTWTKDTSSFYSTTIVSGGLYIKGYSGSDTELVIPSSINGKSVIGIDNNAFYYTDLTSVVIPDTVTYIGSSAFNSCPLSKIKLSNNLTYIGQTAFYNCPFTNIVLPDSITTIESNAFAYCTNLTSLILPKNLTKISESAFSYCYNLTSIAIPSSVTNIEGAAFCDCSNLTNVIFENPNNWTATRYTDVVNLNSSDLSNQTTAAEKLLYYCKYNWIRTN